MGSAAKVACVWICFIAGVRVAAAVPQLIPAPGGAISNPSVVAGEAAAGDLKRAHFTNGRCSGMVREQPDYLLQIPPIATGDWAIEAKGQGLWIKHPDGRSDCRRRVTLDAGQAAGQTLQVWLVAGLDAPAKPYRITVEDLGAPLTPPWTEKTPVLTLREVSAPALATARIQRPPPLSARPLPESPGCQTRTLQPRPIAVLDVKAPVKGRLLKVATAEQFSGEIVVMGPYADTVRVPPFRCARGGTLTLDPGRYAVFFPAREPKSGLVTIQLGRRPAGQFPIAPGAGGLAEVPGDRELGLLIPSFSGAQTRTDFKRDWAGRFALLSALPRAVFVYPKQDLDATRARYIVDGRADDHTQFPKKNEPLVIISARERPTYLTVDGLLYSIAAEDLALSPEGPVALPAEPRPWATRDPARFVQGAEADKILGPYRAAAERTRKCATTLWEKQAPSAKLTVVEGRLEVELDDPQTRARVERLVAGRCRYGVEAKKASADEKLRALLATQRKAAYAALRPRLEVKLGGR